MRRLLLLSILLFMITIGVQAQTFTSSAVITITRQQTGGTATQAKADAALARDIERYVISFFGAIVGPTEKVAGVCLPFSGTLGSRTVNLAIYNRDPVTCLPAIVNGKTDLKNATIMEAALRRLIVMQFNFYSDRAAESDAVKAAADAATATAATTTTTTRAAEKVDPPEL